MRFARLLIGVAAIGAVAALMPAAAAAGGYVVQACNPSVAGGANNAFVPVASPGMTAFVDCPAGQGMTVRNGWDNGTSAFLEGAFLVFDAPQGNTVESISYEMGIERHNCSWGVGLVASGYDLAGTRVWGFDPGAACDSASTPGPTNFFPTRWNHAINQPRVRIESRCGAGTCPRNGISAMRIRNVEVRVKDDVAPSLTAARGPLWDNTGWMAGTQSIGFDASDAAGIREAVVSIDNASAARKNLPCDYTRPAPCPSAAIDEPLNTAGWGGDGEHTVTLTAVDAAGNPATVSRTVRVDNTPPDAPTEVVVEGGDGWRSKNSFDIRWKNIEQKAAPIAGVEYELCPATGEAPCVRGSKAGEKIEAIRELAIPAPGEYGLKLWLRDAAGNQDERIAASPVMLRYDDASPEIALVPLTADDPTRVAATVSDRGSGVAGGTIEIRRWGETAWTTMPTVVEGTQIAARIDDERLVDGVYEIRGRVSDNAGNERSTSALADGRPLEVTLPLRLKTSLRAGVVLRRGTTARLARRARVGYGRLVRVSGRLTSPEGNPLQDFEVQAITQIRDGVTPERLLATVRTSKTGRFSFLVRKGPSRTIKIRYVGAPQVRGATRELILDVRSNTTLRPNRRALKTGETVRFRGRVLTGRIPAPGKLVELQVRVRERWRTFATTRTSKRGRWTYGYRFDGTSGRITYRFRARVPREAGYPFVTGDSRVVRVKVRGL